MHVASSSSKSELRSSIGGTINGSMDALTDNLLFAKPCTLHYHSNLCKYMYGLSCKRLWWNELIMVQSQFTRRTCTLFCALCLFSFIYIFIFFLFVDDQYFLVCLWSGVGLGPTAWASPQFWAAAALALWGVLVFVCCCCVCVCVMSFVVFNGNVLAVGTVSWKIKAAAMFYGVTPQSQSYIFSGGVPVLRDEQLCGTQSLWWRWLMQFGGGFAFVFLL